MFRFKPFKKGKLRLILCELLLISGLFLIGVGVTNFLLGSLLGLIVIMYVYYELNKGSLYKHYNYYETTSKTEWNNFLSKEPISGVLAVYMSKNGILQGASVVIDKNLLEYNVENIKNGTYKRSDKRRVEGLPDLPKDSVNKFGETFHLWNRTHAIPYHYCLSEGEDIPVTFIGSRKLNSGVDVNNGIYYVPYEEYEKENKLYRKNKVYVDTHRNKARKVLYEILDNCGVSNGIITEEIQTLGNKDVNIDELSLVDIESLVTLLMYRLSVLYTFKYTMELTYGDKYNGYSNEFSIPQSVTVSLKVYPHNKELFNFTLEN